MKLARILAEPLAMVDRRLQHPHLARATLVRPALPQRYVPYTHRDHADLPPYHERRGGITLKRLEATTLGLPVTSMTGRRLRHLSLAGFVALVCVVAYGLTRGQRPTTIVLSLGLGYASLALLLLALATGPWVVISGRRMPVSTMFRRDVGIWAAIAGGLHVVFGLQSHMGGRIVRYFLPDQPGWNPSALLFFASNWIGAVATLILLGLLLLSNNLSLRALGARRWKSLQRFTYLLAALTIVHTVGYQIIGDRGRTWIPLTVSAVAVVVVFQFEGFRRMRGRLKAGREAN